MDNDMDKQNEGSEKKTKHKKLIILLFVFVALLFFCCVISMVLAEPSETNKDNDGDVEVTNKVVVSIEPTSEVPTIIPTLVPTLAPSVVPTEVSEEDKISNIVRQELRGKNNLDKDYLNEVRVTEQFEGGWGVFVGFNAGDNLTTNLRKTGIEVKMSELYTALYNSESDIRRVHITAYFPLTDQYGNTEDGVVYATSLDKAEADKINWDANKTDLQLSILPGVWKVKSLHNEFR